MRIIELKAENFARLTAIEIRPDGRLVQITGANGEGKTSTLNAIWACLKGRAAAPPVPIRKGCEQATLRVSLGRDTAEMVVTRTFRHDKHGDLTTDIRVTMGGKPVTRSPQAAIDAILGEFATDPLAFARLDPKAKFDRLKGLVPGVDFEAVALQREELFDLRTEVNRVAKDRRAQANGIVLPAGPEPEAVDVAGKLADISRAAKHNQDRLTAAQARQNETNGIDELLDNAEQLRARAASMEAQAATRRAALEALPALPAPIQADALHLEVAAAQAVDKVRALFAARREHEKVAAEKEREGADLTGQIEALDVKKREAVAAAKLPVPGLSFGDGALLLDGLPFEQAAMSVKLLASAQLAIALNPRPEALRVMTIDEGSELDSKALAALAKLAEAHDYDIWLSRVDESGEVGFVIHDGAVVP